MTEPRHAHDVDGKGRFYTHPVTGQQLISVTNALSVGMAKYGLPLWYAANAAEYAMDNLPAIVARSRTDRDGALKDIKAAAERVRDKAANLGTRVHDLAEAHVLGNKLAREEGDETAELFIDQYLKFLSDYGIDIGADIVSAEMTVADPDAGYAGTLDVLANMRLDGFMPGGAVKRLRNPTALWQYDIKTSMTRASTQVYASHALQLTALKHAKEMWLPDDSVAPMVRGIKGCAVLNLRPKTYRFIPLPTGVPEVKAWRSILTLAHWLHDEWPGEYDYRPLLPDATFVPKRGTKTTDEQEKDVA